MTKNKTPKGNQENGIGQIPEAIEGAFVVVLAQNALLLSRPITEIGQGVKLNFFQIVIIAVALINFFNIAANWLSVRKANYTQGHLFWDIITLATFLMFTQLLTDSYQTAIEGNLPHALKLTGVCYFLINIVYVVWNKIEIRNISASKIYSQENVNTVKTLNNANIGNYISMVFAIILAISSTFTDTIWVVQISFLLWVINWILMMIYYMASINYGLK